MNIKNSTIKSLALKTGFSACGVGNAALLADEKTRLESWLEKNYHGEMQYLARDPEKRSNPALLLDNARSIIMLAYHYAPDPALIPAAPYQMARFALGLDYHRVLKEKMLQLVNEIAAITGPFQYKIFTDSAPVLEKAWAVKTGIGWVGKNTLLQVKGRGSWFLLCEIITDLDIEPDPPNTQQQCGNCRRCLDACPTGALTEPYILDARKCLTYLNYETEGTLAEDLDLNGYLYGCDICQEVCPFNKPIPYNQDSWLKPNPLLAKLQQDEWLQMTEEEFNTIFDKTRIKRSGYALLQRNLRHIHRDT